METTYNLSENDFSVLNMNARKVHIISLITLLNDNNLLEEIEKMILKKQSFIKTSIWERNALDQAMEDVKANRLTSHETVDKEMELYLESL
jgi:hypothetical protein